MNVGFSSVPWLKPINDKIEVKRNFSFRAPTGCLQYFYGDTRHTVESYNWDGTTSCSTGCLYDEQAYSVCFRPEKGIETRAFSYTSYWYLILRSLIYICVEILYLLGMCGMQYSQTTVSSSLNSFGFRDEESEVTTQQVRS